MIREVVNSYREDLINMERVLEMRRSTMVTYEALAKVY